MKIKRIEYLATAVHDMEAMRAILEDKFRMTLEYVEAMAASNLAMYPIGETYIELLEGTTPDSGTTKWIEKNGQSLFHICL